MSKVGVSIIKGAKESLAYAKVNKKTSKSCRVKISKKINVMAIRNNLHMSQNAFAACFGFSVRTIQKWEQGIRKPSGAARAYLSVISKNPDAVREALKW